MSTQIKDMKEESAPIYPEGKRVGIASTGNGALI
jgi:hypothetical protein